MNSNPLVSAEWLMEHLEAPDIRVIDATWIPSFQNAKVTGRDRYMGGHIPGTVFFDIDQIADQDSSLPHMLPNSVQFSAAVRQLGIGDGNRLVIYDSNTFCASARVWWMFRVMGVEDVSVLNGGLKAWQDIRGRLEDIPSVPTTRHFTPRVNAELVKTLEQVEQHTPSAIVDARAQGRFDGTQAEPRQGLPSGHIPGSLNLPWQTLINTSSGKLLDRAELETILPKIDGQIVCSCGSGVTAAIVALAYASLGKDNVAVYDGSWTEWASSNRPIETSVS